MVLAITAHKSIIHMLLHGMAINNTPINIDNVLKVLNKCQASVKPTNNVVDPRNLGPSNGFPFLYLFLQERFGSQNNLFLKWKKTEYE